MKRFLKKILLVMCFALILTGCKKKEKQEITPDVLEYQDLRGTLGGKKYNKVEFYRYNIADGAPDNAEDKSVYETIMAINNLYSSQSAKGNAKFFFSSSASVDNSKVRDIHHCLS